MRHNRPLALALSLVVLGVAAPSLARPGGWGGPGGWGEPGWGRGWDSSHQLLSRNRRLAGPVEGRVTVSRFVAEGTSAQALGHGTVSVVGAPATSGGNTRVLATYEAAVIDQLVRLGYRTDIAETGGHVAELTVTHDTAAPQENRKPVSGEMAVGVSNRGSMVGLGVNVDLSKPRGALIATRLEARIKDKTSGAVLWEGRADVITRDGDEAWSESAVASRLASALFDGFPGITGENIGAP